MHAHSQPALTSSDRLTALEWKKRSAISAALTLGTLGLILIVVSLVLLSQEQFSAWPAYNAGLSLVLAGVMVVVCVGAFDAHKTFTQAQLEHSQEIAELSGVVDELRKAVDAQGAGTLRELLTYGDQLEERFRDGDRHGDDTGPHRRRHN